MEVTTTDKLQKLIERAINKGWDVSHKFKIDDDSFEDITIINITFLGDGKWAEWKPQINTLIFNHDFARALFGEHTETMMVQNNTLNVHQVIDMDGWRYHLQQAVVSKDPIDYMYEQVFGNE